MDYYILVDHTPVLVDPDTFSHWFELNDRTVKNNQLENCTVSTVFLGLDHSLEGNPPLLFETMVFGGENDSYQKRYSTWDEAMEGHTHVVAMCKS